MIVNRPFRQGELTDRLKRQKLPEWAAESGVSSWAQLMLKFILSHPAVIVAIPLLHYTVEHPEQFWYRAATRVASVEAPVGAEPLAIFGRNVLHMFLAFDWRGASTWVVMRPYEPFLDAVTGALLVAGAVLLLVRIFRGSARWAIVALSFFVLTLPSTLSLAFPAENPSVNRSGTAIPVIFLVAALPVVDLVARRQSRDASVAAGAGLAALLAFSVYGNYRDYLVDFHRSYDKAVDHSLAMAHVLDGSEAEPIELGQPTEDRWEFRQAALPPRGRARIPA